MENFTQKFCLSCKYFFAFDEKDGWCKLLNDDTPDVIKRIGCDKWEIKSND